MASLQCVRSHWEDESGKLGAGFSIDAVVNKKIDVVFDRAGTLYDTIFGNTPASSQGGGGRYVNAKGNNAHKVSRPRIRRLSNVRYFCRM